MLVLLFVILYVTSILESVNLRVRITFIIPYSSKCIQNIINRRLDLRDLSENGSDYWFKLPKEYKISEDDLSISESDQSINVRELNELGIPIGKYVDLSDEKSIKGSISHDHPLSNRVKQDSTSSLEDLYYSDVVLSTRENESSNIDVLTTYENEMLNSSIDNDTDSIQESLMEANRMIDDPIEIDDENNYQDNTFPKLDKIPPKNYASGEYLIDRHLIHKVAALRSYLEILEKGVEKGKLCIRDNLDNPLVDIFCCFNDSQMKMFKQLVLDEGLFEEVIGRAMAIYERVNDSKSLERVTWIASTIGPWVNQLRKDSANEKLSILISLALTSVNDESKNKFSDLLWNYCESGLLDRYLIRRCDELISEARKKYRIDEQVPSVSEVFLTGIKNQIIAQMITNLNGTDLYIKTLIKCLNSNRDEWDGIVNDNIKSMEERDEFIEWLNVGAEYVSRSHRPGKIVTAENLLEIIDELGDGVKT